MNFEKFSSFFGYSDISHLKLFFLVCIVFLEIKQELDFASTPSVEELVDWRYWPNWQVSSYHRHHFSLECGGGTFFFEAAIV